MAFSPTVAEAIAYRSAYICNAPECNALTVGPAMADPNLKNKCGQAAHIVGEKKTAARYRDDAGPAYIASAANGIWLCSSCHDLVDKNKGRDYSEQELLKWKHEHEEMIATLLRTHQSPLPLVRRFSINAKVAQEMVNTFGNKGVMYRHAHSENIPAAIASLKEIRKTLAGCQKEIELDAQLSGICSALIKECREVMNHTSTDRSALFSYLIVMRDKVGKILYRLESEYGCHIPPELSEIVRK